jgi:hypothetical protein
MYPTHCSVTHQGHYLNKKTYVMTLHASGKVNNNLSKRRQIFAEVNVTAFIRALKL